MTKPKIASDNVLSIIRDFGAPITVAEIGALLGLDMTDEQTRRDVANRAGYLVTSGKANRVGPGMYQAANGVQTAVTATPAPAPAPKTSKAAKAAQADELFERVGKATEALFPKGIPMTRIIEVAELQKAMLKVVGAMTWRTVGVYDERVAVEAHSGGQVIVGSAYDSYQAAQFRDVDDLRAFMAWLAGVPPTPEPEPEVIGFTFDPDDDMPYSVIGDLRQAGDDHGMSDEANYDAAAYLRPQFPTAVIDPEFSCFYAYMETQAEAERLLEALNAFVQLRRTTPQERTSP